MTQTRTKAKPANGHQDQHGGRHNGHRHAAPPWQRYLRRLYESHSRAGYRFRYGLVVFDVVTILFIVVTSFMPRTALIEILDIVFGLTILADFAARIAVSRKRLHDLVHPASWADAAAIVSFLAPVVGEGVGFLRILRTVRLLRTYHLLRQLRGDSRFFKRNEDVIFAVTNLVVFIFLMTGIVYETQHYSNSQIANYADALYFTVTALTTTGFGDITLPGTTGRLITVAIMIFGVTLFFNLAKALISPSKVRFACPDCGLQRHDIDAVHCKACGKLLNIPDQGRD